MKENVFLFDFFSSIKHDPRIRITHIGVYAALLQFWKLQRYQNPLVAYGAEVMKVAKLSSSTTYYKSMQELSEFGYLRYEPSFKRNAASKIYMLNRQSIVERQDGKPGYAKR